MAIQTRRQSLTQARLLFNQQGAVPGGMVAEPILRSWRRCADLGFDMRGLRPAEPLTQAELREARERNEALRRMSDPVMAELRKRAHGQGGLSDSRGLVLDCGGDLDFAQRASRIALMPGSLGRGRGWHQCHRHGAGRGPFHRRARGRALFRAQPHPDLRGGAAVRQPGTDPGRAGPGRRAASGPMRWPWCVPPWTRSNIACSRRRTSATPCCACMPIRPGWGRRARRCWPSGATCWSGPTGWRCGRWNSATALGVYRHEDLFEDALTHAPDATGRVQARNGAVYHARLSLPPSPAPRVVPAPERSQPAPSRPRQPPSAWTRRRWTRWVDLCT